MRLVQILVQHDDRDDVFGVLDEGGVDFVALSVDQHDAVLVSFPLPSGAVEEVMGRLRETGVDTEQYTVINDVDGAITPNLDALEDRYTEGPDAESRVARGELRTSAREIEPDRTMFVVQVVLSATVAAAGLLLDSSIVVVGSMVISPFTSSLLSGALGAIIDDFGLLMEGFKSQLFGVVLAVFIGAAVGLLANWTAIVPPDNAIAGIKLIDDFSSPSLLLSTIAVAAGSASAVALATKQGVVLAGVAVAAAVVPSATAAGIGLAWTQFAIARGGLTVLLTNIALINVVSYITFLLLGYRPSMLEDIL